MVPNTIVEMADSFKAVEIQEPGFYRTVDPYIFARESVMSNGINFSSDGVTIEPVLGMFTLTPRVEYDRLALRDGLYDTYTQQDGDVFSVERQDMATKLMSYPYTDEQYYPFIVQTKETVMYNDQSFVINIQNREMGEYADVEKYMFICIKGITPNVVNQSWSDLGHTEEYANTLVLSFPLFKNEAIKYGFTHWDNVSSEIEFDRIEDVCLNVYDLGATPDSIARWLQPGSMKSLTFRRLDNYLYIGSNALSGIKPITTGANFSIVDPIVKLMFTGPCAPYIQFGDIKYQTGGSANLKVRLGYSATEQAILTAEPYRVASDTKSTVATGNTQIIGEYLFGELFFSSDTDLYTPVVYYVNVVVPAKYTRTSAALTSDISDIVFGWNISLNEDSTPTAKLDINNGAFPYDYDDFDAWIGKQIRIWSGYEETGIRPRFTGVVTDISVNRSSPSMCTLSLQCKGLTHKLDLPAMFDRIYDGQYHQDAVLDLLSSAGIGSCVIESPADVFDLLFVGKNEPKYQIKIGENYRQLVNNMSTFAGYVLDEDEWGNAIYAHRGWRNTGISTYSEYGGALYSSITINSFDEYDTINDISSFSLTSTHENIRTTVQVIGLADRDIDESADGLYPAYKRGDPIRIAVENAELIDKIGHQKPLVLMRPDLCTPDQCMVLALNVLKIVAEAEKKANIGTIGDNTVYPGMVRGVSDANLFSQDMYIRINSLSESYNNGTFAEALDGPLYKTWPGDS